MDECSASLSRAAALLEIAARSRAVAVLGGGQQIEPKEHDDREGKAGPKECHISTGRGRWHPRKAVQNNDRQKFRKVRYRRAAVGHRKPCDGGRRKPRQSPQSVRSLGLKGPPVSLRKVAWRAVGAG